MDTLTYIESKFGLDLSIRMPIDILNFDREEFAKLLCELGFKIGVEVGVCGGQFSVCLCTANPGLKLYSIDPYSMSENNDNYGSQKYADISYRNAQKRIRYSGINCTLMKTTSALGVKEFQDESLDFVFIDGNHTYPYVWEDMNVWLPKIRIGGIISGHDYRTANNCQVFDAVNIFTTQNNISPWFVFGGKDLPYYKSWMWVK